MSIFVQWENNKTPLNAENLNVINDVAKQLGEDVAHLSDVVVDIDENFSAKVQNELTEVKSSINTINETTSRLQQQTSSNNTNITNIQKTIADNNSALEEKINTNKNNLTALQSVVNDNKTELDGKITTNKNNLNTLQQNVNNINSTLDNKITVNKNKLDNLEQNINNVNSTLDGKIATNKDNILNIQNSLLTGQYTSYSGTNLTCNDTLSSKTSNMLIKGQTYQNLCGLPIDKEYSTSSNTGTIINIDYKLFKQNTLYTCIVFVKHSQNIICDSTSSYLRIQYKTGETLGGLTGNITTDYKLFKFRFTTKSNDNYILINQRNANDGTQTFKNMIILEGDWINKEVPNYITGIESVGEKENNKISILSHNKNLFDESQLDFDGEYYTCNYDRAYFNSCKYKVKVNPNTVYRISYNIPKDKSYWISVSYFVDGMPVYGFHNSSVDCDQTFTTPSGNEIYLVLAPNTPSDSMRVKNVMLTLGAKKYEYEPYKEDKKEILLPIEGGLKSLPDGTCDTIEQREDGVYLLQRIDKVIFNGSENWNIDGGFTNQSQKVMRFSHGLNNASVTLGGSGDKIICDTLPISDNELGATLPKIWCSWKNYIYIDIDPTKLNISYANDNNDTKINKFKAWLQANPTTVYYLLATPIETKLDTKDINVETFDDLTYILTNNNIQPELEFKIPSNLGALIQNNAKKINELFKLIDELIIPQLTTNTSNIAVLQITK